MLLLYSNNNSIFYLIFSAFSTNLLDIDDSTSRREHPTLSDIAASAVIWKTQRKQNNTDVDIFCDLIHSLNVPNAPTSWKLIKQRFKLDVAGNWSVLVICNSCGKKANNLLNVNVCAECNSNCMVSFYHYPLVEQLQHLLLIPNIYRQTQKQRLTHINDFNGTRYAQILSTQQNDSFTMILNVDGIVTNNKHVSLWPITLMINEVPLPVRGYSETVLVGGVISAVKHPSNKLFQTIFNVIVEQYHHLEMGVNFYIPGGSERLLKFFLIGSCADKPAQSLIANMVACNASSSCSKCIIKGK